MSVEIPTSGTPPIQVKREKKRRIRKKDDKDGKKEEDDVNQDDKGHGTFIFGNSARYGTDTYLLSLNISEGDWEKTDGGIKRNGRGCYMEGNNKYDGEWKDDKMSGWGKYFYASGAFYEVQCSYEVLRLQGEWVEGKYHGKGKYTFPDGSFYEGEWVENRMHGSGSFTDIVSGAQFRGQFYNNSGPGLQAWLM